MSNRFTNIIATCLLLFIFLICLFSIKDDSVTMDEAAHLPAGYSYLTQKDMRLNPEHPPLIKDLAAVPLLFIKNINFPSDIKAWQEDINGQWDFGFNFLYNAGNPVDEMAFGARIPMILVLVLLGFYVFKWSREIFGNNGALLALSLFSFSPTLLAHGRLVTTDVGAAAGIFIATYYFTKALKNPSWVPIILAGISFGLAELAKFSTILLVPFFVFLALIWWLVKAGKLWPAFKVLILTFVIGFLLVWPVYAFHVWNYPVERQVQDTSYTLSSFKYQQVSKLIIWMAGNPVLRPYAQYLLGLAMVYQRTTGGNTTYFLGEVSASGWKNYFPVIYGMKEPLAFHIFAIIALLYSVWPRKKVFSGISEWFKTHFAEFSMLFFIAIFWVYSLSSNLNIGVRHLMPVLPLTMVLAGGTVSRMLKKPYLQVKYLALAGLILWQVFSVLRVCPHFIAYFNELAGGPANGYIYAADSNLDWGQDLKRLKQWTDKNSIDKIYLDYFGGGDPQYYLKEKYVPWQGTYPEENFPENSYLAVSATLLQGGRGIPVAGFTQASGYYNWLYQYEPIAKIGYSIFVYFIP